MNIGNYKDYLEAMECKSKTYMFLRTKGDLISVFHKGKCLLNKGTDNDVNKLNL